MESALRPREIQSRIRAGHSVEEVARDTGMPLDRVQRFAYPVLAEREHVALLALSSSVRRHGETSAHRNLRPVVRERLLLSAVDPDGVEWDAWRNEDRRWSVRGSWVQDGASRTATFQFDTGGRFSIAMDAEARRLIAEAAQSDPLGEVDELALVRAVGVDDEAAANTDDEPTVALSDAVPHPVAPAPAMAGAEDEEPLPRSVATPQEVRESVEAEIAAYGLVPEGRSELDVLYDMLGGIAEDSINIYAGLSDPVVATSPPAAERTPEAAGDPGAVVEVVEVVEAAERIETVEVTETVTVTESIEVIRAVVDVTEPADVTEAVDVTEAADTTESPEVTGTPAEQQPESSTTRAPDDRFDPSADDPQRIADQAREVDDSAPPLREVPSEIDLDPAAGQSSLVEDDPEATIQVRPGAAKRGPRKKRASVPSWDEIMFGGPKRD